MAAIASRRAFVACSLDPLRTRDEKTCIEARQRVAYGASAARAGCVHPHRRRERAGSRTKTDHRRHGDPCMVDRGGARAARDRLLARLSWLRHSVAVSDGGLLESGLYRIRAEP